jgi:hypothetical protein
MDAPWVAATAAIFSAGVVGLQFILYGRLVQRNLSTESVARAMPSVNVTVHARVLPFASQDPSDNGSCVLETRVELHNNARDTVCIPAVYVSTRPLRATKVDNIRRTNEREIGYYTSDFFELDEHPGLSTPRNIAALPISVIQLAPDEVEHFVRWDKISRHFIETNPVAVVNVEVFGASVESLGRRYDGHVYSNDSDAERMRWLEFMKAQQGHNRIIFGRAERQYNTSRGVIEKGERIILARKDWSLEHDKPNIKSDDDAIAHYSMLFDDVRRSVAQWGRHTTVDLASARQTGND